jgi:hypothetical protein
MNRRTFTIATAALALGTATAGCLTVPSARPAVPIFETGTRGASSVDNDALGELLDGLATGDLTETEREDLFWMREEEKLAHDVYLYLYDDWGLQIHGNIVDSEQSHMDAMLHLIEKYELEDPAADAAGTFTNDELQAMYDELIDWGDESVLDSLKVGCRIEATDIRDIQTRIDRTDEEAIVTVYENLLKGSRNHLRAFYRVLTRRGGDYEPTIISPEQFDEIVSSDFETGTE